MFTFAAKLSGVLSIVLLLANSAPADEQPVSRPPVVAVVSVGIPGEWRLDVRDDGSAELRYAGEPGAAFKVPASTFDAEEVRKNLLALKSVPKEEHRGRAHYMFWFEFERKLAPNRPPPSHYSQDETVIVPLFERAAVASELKNSLRGAALLKEKPFGLPAAAKLRDLYGLQTPSGWMLSIRNDGSAQLVFGDGGGANSCVVPAATFQPQEVRKTLNSLKLDPQGSGGTHFVVWYEEERKSTTEGPQARYTQDESAVVRLFEQAARARPNKPAGGDFEQLGGRRPSFGLTK